MASFKTVALKEICHLITDGVHQKPDYKASGIPFVSIKDFSNGKFSLENTKFISESDHLQFNKRCNPQFNDILYSKVGSYGIACLVETHQPFSLYVSVCLIKPKRDIIDSKFLLHLLNSPIIKRQADKCVKGIGVPDLHLIEIKNFQIPLPPLAEQQRIAAILDKADALREKRRRAIAKLDELQKSVFLEMFGDPVSNPKGWEIKKISDLLVVGPQNGIYKPISQYGKGTPILRIDAFYDGSVTDINNLKRVSLLPEEQSLYGLQEGDIVINRVNSLNYLGKSALIPKLKEPTVFESNMMRMAFNTTKIHPKFIIQYLQSNHIKSQILTCAKNAVNQSSINQQDVKGFCVFVPPQEFQLRFANVVNKIGSLKIKALSFLEASEHLFLSLQQRAFSGELFAQQANEELDKVANEEKPGQMSLFDLMG